MCMRRLKNQDQPETSVRKLGLVSFSLHTFIL